MYESEAESIEDCYEFESFFENVDASVSFEYNDSSIVIQEISDSEDDVQERSFIDNSFSEFAVKFTENLKSKLNDIETQ